jgi:hypothetical protein
MSVLDQSLDYSQPEGWTTRAKECDKCIGQGNSNAVQITRKEDGFLWHCFRCEKTGFIPDTSASPDQVVAASKAHAKGRDYNRPEVVVMPPDYTTQLPPAALVQLYDMDIMQSEIERYEIGWVKSRERITLPIYRAHKLIGIVGRKLETADESKPKWWSVRQAGLKHIWFTALPSVLKSPKQVVLVEDVFSAIRVASNGWIAVALLTTYLPYELYPVLNGWLVHIWLDSDAYDKAAKYQVALGSHGITSNIVYTDLDPKKYNNQKIEEAILNGRVTS